MWRKVISIRIPAAYLGTVALVTLVFHRTDAGNQLVALQLHHGQMLLAAGVHRVGDQFLQTGDLFAVKRQGQQAAFLALIKTNVRHNFFSFL